MVTKKDGCPPGQVNIDGKCIPGRTRVNTLDSKIAHGLFRYWQKRYGIKSGDIDPGWYKFTEEDIKDGWVTAALLSYRIKKYYEYHHPEIPKTKIQKAIPPKPKYSKCNKGHPLQPVWNDKYGDWTWDCPLCIENTRKERMKT